MEKLTARNCARELVHNGFLIVPHTKHQIPPELIELASVAGQSLIEWLSTRQLTTCFAREGEHESDVLLIHRDPSQRKDLKYFLHVMHDVRAFIKKSPGLLQLFRMSPERLDELRTLIRLYDRVNTMLGSIIDELALEFHPYLLGGVDLNRDFRATIQGSIPYNVTTLRSLWYPAVANQTGAKMHPDRSFITAHFGDKGGELLGHLTMDDTKTFPLSPKTGEILLFFGMKAALVSRGEFLPLYHSATAERGKDRRAFVQFGHVNYGKIDDARAAFVMFCQMNNIPDGPAWYEDQWAKKMASC